MAPVLGSSTSAGLANPQTFDIRSYGAKVDGRNVYDAGIALGGNVLTSATAGFTVADLGRTVVVVGCGPASREMVATIGTITDSATVILSGTASIAGTGVLATIATDDTAAVRAALADCASAGGGTIYHPGGICLLSGAQQTGTVSGPGYTYSGTLMIPARPYTAGQATIRFLGATPPPLMFYGVINRSQVIQPESGCAVYQFTAGSGNGIDCIPNGTANAIGDYMSSWTVISEDLMWRFPNNPQCGGLKLLQVGDASLARSKIGINANVGYMAAPSGSTTTCTALTLPGLNDNGLTEVRTCCITGFPAGLWHNEHTVLDNVYINYCAVGIRAGGGAHASNWSNVYLYQCGTAIKPSGSIVLQGGTIAFEQGPLFPGYRMEIDDWNGYLVGFLSYEGPQINVNGAWRLDLRSAGMPTQRSSLTPSLTASAMFSSGSAFPPVGGLPQLSTGQTWNCVGSDWCAGGGAAFAPGGGYATTQITNGVNPIVTMDVTTGATSAIGAILLGERDAQPHFSAVMVGGTTAQIREGSTVMASATFTYSPNAAYTIVADYGVTTPGAITMKVGGSVVVAYSLSDAQRVGYVGRTWVGMRIIAGSDNGSKVTRFAAS